MDLILIKISSNEFSSQQILIKKDSQLSMFNLFLKIVLIHLCPNLFFANKSPLSALTFLKSVFYEENLVLQCSHLEVVLLSKFGSERGDFN